MFIFSYILFTMKIKYLHRWFKQTACLHHASHYNNLPYFFCMDITHTNSCSCEIRSCYVIVAETTVYFRTPRNAHSFFVEDFQSDALYWFIYIKEYFIAVLIEHCSKKFRIHFHRVMSAREQDRMKKFRAYSKPKNSRNFSYPRIWSISKCSKINMKWKIIITSERSERSSY